MNRKRKKAHLDEGGVIRFGRAELWIAVVTVAVAVTSLIGNVYYSVEKGKETAQVVQSLAKKFNGMETRQAVTATEVRRNREEMGDVKIRLGFLETKIDRLITTGITLARNKRTNTP